MKLVHCVGWYLPESVGGSELYVHGLTLALQRRGVEVTVMAPTDGDRERRYVHDGVDVIRYPVDPRRSLAQHEGDLPHTGFEVFQRQLAALAPDVFHLHSLTYGCGVRHIRYARALGLTTLATFHVPDVICARGTMVRFGEEVCDGRIDARQCVPCWLTARGLPKSLAIPSAQLLRGLPRFAGRAARGPLQTVLQAHARIAASARTLHELGDLADRVVAVCAWLNDAFVQNGMSQDKLVLCRQGVPRLLPAETWGPLPSQASATQLRIGYFGRGTSVKGVDVLVRAVCNLPRDCAVELRVYAVANNEDDRRYMSSVISEARGDSRIRFVPPVPADEVQHTMRHCDIVAVPSTWLETGPLVAMEALAAGIPVLGSDLGGVRELIEPGVTGWLVAAGDVARWSRAIEALAAEGAARLRWDRARTPVMTMDAVAARMHGLYQELLS